MSFEWFNAKTDSLSFSDVQAQPSETEEIHMFNQCVDNSRESDRDAACSSPALC